MKRIGIVACSNGLDRCRKETMVALGEKLVAMGIEPIYSNCLYVDEKGVDPSATMRANALMAFYQDKTVTGIFDVSGGDVANEVLPYIDFDIITNNPKPFWGYSDLTTVLNAIYTKTGQAGVLYQLRNILQEEEPQQALLFQETYQEGKNSLFALKDEKVPDITLSGIVVGGNIRCFLKLAGTPYWPSMKEKVLLLEARGGGERQIRTYLAQLQQLGVFQEVAGVILGTFTELEKNLPTTYVTALVKNYLPKGVPVVRTATIGHGGDSLAIWIGKEVKIG